MSIDASTIEQIVEHAKNAVTSGDPAKYLDCLPIAQRDQFDEFASPICDMASKLIADGCSNTEDLTEAYTSLRSLRAGGFIDGRRTSDFCVGESVVKDDKAGIVTAVDKQIGCLWVSWNGSPAIQEQATRVRLGTLVEQYEDVFDMLYAMDEDSAKAAAARIPVQYEPRVVRRGLEITTRTEDHEISTCARLIESKKRRRKTSKPAIFAFAGFNKVVDDVPTPAQDVETVRESSDRELANETPDFENQGKKELLKASVQTDMFCKFCDKSLDAKSAVNISVPGTFSKTVCGNCFDTKIKEPLLAKLPHAEILDGRVLFGSKKLKEERKPAMNVHSLRAAYNEAVSKPVYRGTCSDNKQFDPTKWKNEDEMFKAVAEVACHSANLQKALNEAASARSVGAMAPVFRLAEALGATQIVNPLQNLNEATIDLDDDHELDLETISIALRDAIRDAFVSQPGASAQEAEEVARIAITDACIGLCVTDPQAAVEKIAEQYTEAYGRAPGCFQMVETIREAAKKVVPKGRKLKHNRTVRVKVVKTPQKVDHDETPNIDLDALRRLERSMSDIIISAGHVQHNLDNPRMNKGLAADILSFYNMLSINQGEPWNPVQMRQNETIGEWSGVLEMTEEPKDASKDSEDVKPEDRTRMAIGFVKPARAISKDGIESKPASAKAIDQLIDLAKHVKTQAALLLGDPGASGPVRSLLIALRKLFHFLIANEHEPWNAVYRVSA